MIRKRKNQNLNAYTVLTSILVVGAILVTISIGGVLLSSLNIKSSVSTALALRSWAIANACAEAGLQQIRNNTSFTGTSNLTVGSDSCSYTVIDLGGQARRINAISQINGATNRLQVTTSAHTPQIIVQNWQEVTNF